MKHLFLVHSPITYLTSVSVIKRLGLSKENTIIIFFEFEKINATDNSYESININEFFKKDNLVKRITGFFKYFNIFKKLDVLVNTVTNNEKYIAYVPVVIWAGKALITNPNCTSFNFIEEGLAHYFKEDTLKSFTPVNTKDPWRSSILKKSGSFFKDVYELLRGHNFRLQALPFSYSCYHGFKNVNYYGFTQDSFPLADEKKRVIVSFEKDAFTSIQQNIFYNLDNAIIWIGDGAVTQHGADKNLYLNAIEKGCVSFLKENLYKKFYIKFHRDEKPALRQEIKNLFTKHTIQFEIIADSTVLELSLFKANNVTLIGVYSSLLYYAAIMNHSAYSVFEFLKSERLKFIAERDFSFFWNKVKLLKANHHATV